MTTWREEIKVEAGEDLVLACTLTDKELDEDLANHILELSI